MSSSLPESEIALQLPFRPRARLLQLLGDELIGSPRLAVFELVKNAYDADAKSATVQLDLRNEESPKIIVVDDGEGMTLETIQNIWLVPADDHRQKQREALVRSAKFHRLPLGEKGLGRFAVHKLGNRISLVTRARDSKECVVEIDWSEMIREPFLSDAPVTVRVRPPEVFLGEQTGTRIEIEELRQKYWNRREVRRLQRQITSICSPFEGPAEFSAELTALGKEGWLQGIPDVQAILDRAIWKFTFKLDAARFDWSYTFRKIPNLKLEGRELSGTNDPLLLPPATEEDRKAKKVGSTQESG